MIGNSHQPEEEEEEEEKEVDPLLVGSLDNVYTEETAAAMMKEEDPFKKAPVMNKESATPAEMEKTVDALIVYESGARVGSRDGCLSPNGMSPPLSPISPISGEGMELDLLTDGSSGSHRQQPSGSTVEQLPDIVDVSSSTPDPPPSRNIRPPQPLGSHAPPPDIAAQSHDLPPDLSAGTHASLDLLNSDGSGESGQRQLVDLTEGVPSTAARRTSSPSGSGQL